MDNLSSSGNNADRLDTARDAPGLLRTARGGAVGIGSRKGMLAWLGVGYALMVLLIGAFGYFAVSSLRQLEILSNELYAHPFAVSNAAMELKGALYQLRDHIIQAVFIQADTDNPRGIEEEMRGFEAVARRDIAVMKGQFLGDKERILELERRLDEWDGVRQKILALAAAGDKEAAGRMVREVGTGKFHETVALADEVLTFAQNRAKSFVDQADAFTDQRIVQVEVTLVVVLLLIAASGAGVAQRIAALHEELNRQATRDSLTGLANRRLFLALAGRELARSKRERQPMSLAVADLDHFKRVNDTHGHQAGDHVLRAFAALCRGELREYDILGRVGGEEFAMVLPGVNVREAAAVVERLRRKVEEAPIEVRGGAELRITASFGVAEVDLDGESFQRLFKRADDALYQAKNDGRNRVRTAA